MWGGGHPMGVVGTWSAMSPGAWMRCTLRYLDHGEQQTCTVGAVSLGPTRTTVRDSNMGQRCRISSYLVSAMASRWACAPRTCTTSEDRSASPDQVLLIGNLARDPTPMQQREGWVSINMTLNALRWDGLWEKGILTAKICRRREHWCSGSPA